MQNISREAVEKLLATTEPQPAVTIYAPMHTTASPPHISENQIRLKNLIHRASEELGKHGDQKQLSDQLQEMLDTTHDDLNFWESQTPGLLICARPGMIEMFHLPIDTDEYVAVDEAFHLAPVLAIMNEEQPYYVLTVAQHGPKLFRGDMYGLKETDVQLPESVYAGLNIDEENQQSENQGSATGPSTNTGWFNGRGGARDPREEDRARFFRMIDNIIYNSADRSLPLILAGIDAETIEYRMLSKYPQILEGTISGSFGDAKPDGLFDRAYAIIEKELIMPAREAALEEYQRLEGANPDKVARDKKSIQEAAEQGRVDKLLAMMGRYTTDTIRDTAASVAKITFPEPEVSKTLNRLALKVWQMSGTIVNLQSNKMPHGALMVARLRY